MVPRMKEIADSLTIFQLARCNLSDARRGHGARPRLALFSWGHANSFVGTKLTAISLPKFRHFSVSPNSN